MTQNKVSPNYTINKIFDTKVQRSARVLEVAEAFGLGLNDKTFEVFKDFDITVNQGDVVYITGESGSGKSLLLKDLERQMKERGLRVANLDHVEIDNDTPLIDQLGKSVPEALRILSVAGINDAYLYIRKPPELSDGQRYRFRLAKAIEMGADVWVADEFMAILDRVAARVIAYSVQKAARRAGATLMVATTHSDMVGDLFPDMYVDKRFREKVDVRKFPGNRAAAGDHKRDIDEIKVLLNRVSHD